MLEISERQFQQFEQDREERFIRQTAERLREDFPERIDELGLSPEDTVTFVRNGIARARQYDVRYEEDLIFYLDCMMTLGLDFDKDPSHPEITAMLQREDIAGDEKMDFIDEYLLFALDSPK